MMNNSKQKSICSIVVTRNRKKDLIKCLDSIRFQTLKIESIIIIDNLSDDGTTDCLLDHKYISKLPSEQPQEDEEQITYAPSLYNEEHQIKVYYIRKCKNDGGSGGFHEGVKQGYQKGYTWLWLMDDDAYLAHNAAEELFKHRKDHKVLNCLVINSETKDTPTFGYAECKRGVNINIIKETYINITHFFNGTLIHRDAVEKVGYPDKGFFIWGDEVDYCRRLQIYKPQTVTTSIIYHPDKVNTFKIGRYDFLIIKDSQLCYYHLRNQIIISNRYFKGIALIKKYINSGIVSTIFLSRNCNFSSFKLIFRAIKDGLANKMGKYDAS